MIKLAEPSASPFPAGMAHLSAGWSLLAKGDWAQAWPHVEQGTAEYRKGNIVLALPHAVATSARILAQLGETGPALSCLQEGEERRARAIVQHHDGGTL